VRPQFKEEHHKTRKCSEILHRKDRRNLHCALKGTKIEIQISVDIKKERQILGTTDVAGATGSN
jgi:hypothetical protein